MDLVASSTVAVGVGERWIKHYSSSHKILLVGEGDFSFSVCLANAFSSAVNMVATSLDTREMVLSKYSKASHNLWKLEELGCTVIHELDLSTVYPPRQLAHKKFDRIVFNFPHAPFFCCREDCDIQIWYHRGVLKNFLLTARFILAATGEIHVTHKTGYPYDKWKVEELGEGVGLSFVEKVAFSKCDYPGYENKRGSGRRSDESFPLGACSTFKFVTRKKVVFSKCTSNGSTSDGGMSDVSIYDHDETI